MNNDELYVLTALNTARDLDYEILMLELDLEGALADEEDFAECEANPKYPDWQRKDMRDALVDIRRRVREWTEKLRRAEELRRQVLLDAAMGQRRRARV